MPLSSSGYASAVSPFRSFWMGGFECTDQLNAFGHRVDFLQFTRHLENLERDYRELALLNIRTVREGIRWSRIEREPFVYDWSVVGRMIEAGRAHGIQQVWDICHFGFPDDLTPLHPMFARRFAAVCRAFATFFRTVDATGVLIVTPINEVSFVSWLGGEVRGTSPYCAGQGEEVKYRLMKAYIEGVEALRAVEPGVRILTTEPLINVIHGREAGSAEREEAARHHESQFEVTDMLGGLSCPELRGRPEYLDVLGVNFYHNNQWVKATDEMLSWKESDGRWVPLRELLRRIYQRYGRPLVLTETSHYGEDRARWMDMVALECAAARDGGVPLWGVCWYPIIDRPDWDHPHRWHRSGIWDRVVAPDVVEGRVLHVPTAEAFLRAQATVAQSAFL